MLLTIDPERRPNAEEALDHHWMRNVPHNVENDEFVKAV
jgi:hypothetical protein